MDGSAIYGSTLKKSRELREFEGGRLRIRNENDHEFLPLDGVGVLSECIEGCYNAGNYLNFLIT